MSDNRQYMSDNRQYMSDMRQYMSDMRQWKREGFRSRWQIFNGSERCVTLSLCGKEVFLS